MIRSMPHDFRSDTVTVPTPAMREAIAAAPVGDDVFGDDPSVNALQERVASMLGKEAALFVPSGTMANQVAIRTHTEPGDEIIAESTSHIFLYEGGGFAALSGVSLRQVEGQAGLLAAADVAAAVRPPGGLSHFPVSKLVCVENTANRGGGTVYPLETLGELRQVADREGLAMHLDGARLMNAAVAQGVDVSMICAPFDSISLCLSKGLGAPVGSLLVGSRRFIDRAHRFRKMFGGGMRQAGILAAAGLHALEHHVDRLADDHRRARRLGEELAALPGVEVDLGTVQTNMVYADFAGTGADGATWVGRLEEAEVLAHATGPTTLRFVTHLQVGDEGVDAALEAVRAGV
mgnify:FL=1